MRLLLSVSKTAVSAVQLSRTLTDPAFSIDQAFTIAQSVGKTAGLCKDGSSFQKFYAICKQCIADNIEDSQKTEEDYVEPQFQQFLNYCEEQSTSLASITLTATRLVTITTPAPCEACVVTTALDYKSRPIVYTLGTQPATEVLKCKYIPLDCRLYSADIMSRLSVSCGNTIVNSKW